MPKKWGAQQGFSFAARLGHVAIRAHAVVLAQRAQSIQRMMRTHTRDLLQLPGGKRRLAEAEKQFARVNEIIKKQASDGE